MINIIPGTEIDLDEDIELEEEPNKTFAIVGNRVIGIVDGLDAIRQAIHIALSVERYDYLIHTWDYGIELVDLLGEPMSYVCPEVQRRITETLMMDDRIDDVIDFEYEKDGSKLIVIFKVITVLGDVEARKEVTV